MENAKEFHKVAGWSDSKVDFRGPYGGWASGHYHGTCRSCGDCYVGDKRSWECADCAYKRHPLKGVRAAG